MTSLADVLVEAKLGFACGTEDPEGIFQFRMNNVSKASDLVLQKRRRIPLSTRHDMARFYVSAGDVLFNLTNSPDGVGKSVLVPELDEPAVFSNHFLRLRSDPSRLVPEYLWRWLQWQFQRGLFLGMTRQWVNQATVSRDDLLALEPSLPSLPEQRRIAAIFDHADALRAKRRQALAHLDTLTKSIFHALFGAPMDIGRWPMQHLGEVARIIRGASPRPAGDPRYFGGDIPWLKISDLTAEAGATVSRIKQGVTEAGRDRSVLLLSGSLVGGPTLSM